MGKGHIGKKERERRREGERERGRKEGRKKKKERIILRQGHLLWGSK